MVRRYQDVRKYFLVATMVEVWKHVHSLLFNNKYETTLKYILATVIYTYRICMVSNPNINCDNFTTIRPTQMQPTYRSQKMNLS